MNADGLTRVNMAIFAIVAAESETGLRVKYAAEIYGDNFVENLIRRTATKTEQVGIRAPLQLEYLGC